MDTGLSAVIKRLVLVLIVFFLCLLALLLGLMLGYAVLGDGESPWAILSPVKWLELIGKFTGK